MRRACSREGRAPLGDGEQERERETAKLYAKIGQLTVERDFLGEEARSMSAPDRRAMVERSGKDLSVRRQCALVGVARSGIYRPKRVAGADDLAVMRRIDELHLELPFYGSRRMTFELNKEGRGVNRKRVRRLMRVMGIEALVPAPRHEQSRARAQDIPLPAARPEDCRAEPRVGGRRDLHPDGMRLPLFRGDHRLGQPSGSGVAAVEHQRCELLRSGAGGSAPSVRNAADFQYRQSEDNGQFPGGLNPKYRSTDW